MSNRRECWFCFGTISKDYIKHIVYKNGKVSAVVYYCSKDCLMNQVEEMLDMVKATPCRRCGKPTIRQFGYCKKCAVKLGAK